MTKPKQMTMFTDDPAFEQALTDYETELEIEQLELGIFGVESGQLIYEYNGKTHRIKRVDWSTQIEQLTMILGTALKEKVPFRAWRDYEPTVIIAAVWQETSGKWYSYIEQNLIQEGVK